MKNIRPKLILLSILFFGIFVIFSYIVAKETFQFIDFDTTVKLQDRLPRRFDAEFSYLSIIGSAEVTFTIAGIFALIYLFRLKIVSFIAWLLIIPASFFEVFGKVMLYHPAPPDFFHRNTLTQTLPSFYIHTNYSYPSGHMTRTIFLITVLVVLLYFSKNGWKWLAILGLIGFGLLMTMTRIYLGEHWLSDVVGGSLLGLSTGLLSSALILRKNVVVSKTLPS